MYRADARVQYMSLTICGDGVAGGVGRMSCRRVERALAAIRAGEFVVVTDGSDRENEGDLIIAAEKATPEKIAFMVNETSGLICVGVGAARLNELELPQMVAQNTESHGTAFTVRYSQLSCKARPHKLLHHIWE